MKRTLPAITALLLFWWLASLAVDRPFLPPPGSAFLAFARGLLDGSLPPHILLSLFRVSSALVAAFIPAFILGTAAGLRRRIDAVVSPVVYVLFPIPKVAFLPVIMLFLGLGNLSKIFLVALIVFFQFYLAVRDETARIDRRYFDSLFSLGGSRRDLLVHVVVPAVLPRVFSALRLSLGTAMAVLFLAETFATRQGIGWYIMDCWTRLAYDSMYGGILALAAVGLLLFGLVDLAQRRFCRWDREPRS